MRVKALVYYVHGLALVLCSADAMKMAHRSCCDMKSLVDNQWLMCTEVLIYSSIVFGSIELVAQLSPLMRASLLSISISGLWTSGLCKCVFWLRSAPRRPLSINPAACAEANNPAISLHLLIVTPRSTLMSSHLQPAAYVD